jgi:hypothetical protein
MIVKQVVVAAGLLSVGSSAVAQRAGYAIDGPTLVSPSSPEIMLDMYVWFEYVPTVAELFGSGGFHFHSSEPEFLKYWSGPHPVTIGEPPPPILPTRIGFVGISQFHYPSRNIFGSQDNPILVFRASWETNNFTPRWVTFWVESPAPLDFYSSWTTGWGYHRVDEPIEDRFRVRVGTEFPCPADCDSSTGFNTLDIFDFLCFQNEFVAGTSYACDCDSTTGIRICDLFDFLCFQDAFANGCP